MRILFWICGYSPYLTGFVLWVIVRKHEVAKLFLWQAISPFRSSMNEQSEVESFDLQDSNL